MDYFAGLDAYLRRENSTHSGLKSITTASKA
jgi:hypothetical protein